MARVAMGGACPHCDERGTVSDVLPDEAVMASRRPLEESRIDAYHVWSS